MKGTIKHQAQGAHIRKLRKQRGFTQEVLEDKSGILQPRISKIENGEEMSESEAISLAQVLHFDIEEFGFKWPENPIHKSLGSAPLPQVAPDANAPAWLSFITSAVSVGVLEGLRKYKEETGEDLRWI